MFKSLRKSLIPGLPLAIVVVIGHLLAVVYGNRLIEAMYYGQVPELFAKLITGQAQYEVSYYQVLFFDLESRAFVLGLLFCWLVYVCCVSRNSDFRSAMSPRSRAALLAAACWIVWLPPVFSAVFATSYLTSDETRCLWVCSLLSLIVVCLIALYMPRRPLIRLAAICLPLALLVTAELCYRAVRGISPKWRRQMTELSDASIPEFMRYAGHPLLGWTGNGSVKPHHNHHLGSQRLTRHNSSGFIGREFDYNKQPGTIRVACLGGSTTESGYPAFLERLLNAGSPQHYEVLNFGMAGWHSGQSLVNFVLNIRDYSPDVVVVHHGWNDTRPLPIGREHPGDYSRSQGAFIPPIWPDRWFVQGSTLYRSFKHLINPKPSHAMLAAATQPTKRRNWVVEIPSHPVQGDLQAESNHRHSRLERNLKTIIALCRHDGVLVVLATMPHSQVISAVRQDDSAENIDANNQVMRKIAQQASDCCVLVDLDRLMTGRHEAVFQDMGHVNDKGKHLKASAIAEKLLSRSQ